MGFKVYITRAIPESALEMLKQVAEVKVWSGELAVPYDTLLHEVKGVDGLLCMLSDKIDAMVIDSAPRLRVISTFAVGYDNIDIKRATEKGIPVGNTPGVLSETTADLAFSLLMTAARRIVVADRYVRNGMWRVAWGPMLMLGQDIFGSTLGIVGMGRIGTAVARRAKGFQMRILYNCRQRHEDLENDMGASFATLPELLSQSDFVSLHVPLTGDTYHLIGADQFNMMKPNAILVNTSRGQVVDQKALYQALKSGRIAGAALDVTEVEPIPLNDPLLTLENMVITPHIGSGSVSTRNRMAVMAAENLIVGLKAIDCLTVLTRRSNSQTGDFRIKD